MGEVLKPPPPKTKDELYAEIAKLKVENQSLQKQLAEAKDRGDDWKRRYDDNEVELVKAKARESRRDTRLSELESSLEQLGEALKLLDRIYRGQAPGPLHDDGMVVRWIDEEIAAFIRKYGGLAELEKGET